MKIGFLINPHAGIGGTVGLKGSDGAGTVAEAFSRGAVPKATDRAEAMLRSLGSLAQTFEWIAPDGPMGGDLLRQLDLSHHLVAASHDLTTAADTQKAAEAMCQQGISLLVFAGGDGTARDLHAVLKDTLPVVGIPAGVKMHSGVFATSPRAAAEVLTRLAQGELVSAVRAEVRDVDEDAARQGVARSRWFGEMLIPLAGGFIQQTKIGGREDEGLALEEIVQGVCALVESEPDRPWILGPGGSLLAIKQRLGCEGTLLGVDVRLPDGAWRLDVTEQDLLQLNGSPRLVVSFGRGQGIVFGRGNQQLSSRVLARLRRQTDIVVVASRSKLAGLEGRALLLDTGDAALDRELAGFWEILCGYDDRLLYRVEPA